METQIINNVFSKEHPLEAILNNGTASKETLRSWLVQRYQFELAMVKKDYLILSRSDDQKFRQMWLNRIVEADSVGGGLESWVKLGLAAGVDVLDKTQVLPGVTSWIDKFIHWCETTDWQIVASGSLSQLQATLNHKNKFETWPALYPWIEPGGLDYFTVRSAQARSDSEKCLEYIRGIGLTGEQLTESASIKRNLMKHLLDEI